MRGPAIFAAMAAVMCLTGAASAADTPASYPADYAKLVAAAEQDHALTIYAGFDSAALQPLLKAFDKAFPKINVEYIDLTPAELSSRVISESKAGRTGDIAWSNAMGAQMKFAQDGNALTYASPEKPNLPGTAVYKDQAYATAYEPALFVHNKRLLPEAQMPKTHEEFLRLLAGKRTELSGKVATYDPERNEAGFTFLSNDEKNFPQLWDLVTALGAAGATLYDTPGTMLERIGSGEHLLGYDVPGSYAVLRARKDPTIGVVYPQDYTELVSYVLLIPAKAKHPNAAKLFLDFVLSREGQKTLAEGGLFAVRSDVEGEVTVKALQEKLGDRLKPIPLDDGTAQSFDDARRADFLKKWQAAIGKH